LPIVAGFHRNALGEIAAADARGPSAQRLDGAYHLTREVRGIRSRHALCGVQRGLMVQGSPAANDNMIAQASASLHSAIGRTESRGAHAREDFPKRDDANWLKHTLAWLDEACRVRRGYRPVHLQPLSNDVASIPPKERVY